MISKKIGSVSFGVLSPDIVRKMSAIRIVTPDTYDEDGYPIEGGLMDLHLGVIDPGLRCKTCGARMVSCPGHFGHIELVRPVVHIGYVKMVYMLLKSTCRSCGRLLLPTEVLNTYKEILVKEEEKETEEGIDVITEEEERALEAISKSKKVLKCPHCKEKQEPIKLIKPTTFYEGSQRLLPLDIRRRLEQMPDADLKILGINPKAMRPEWAVLMVLPVPPVTTRPSITLESGERSEDDLTHKLVDILRINQRLRDNISAGAPQLIIEDLWDLLQYHITTYFNNEVSGIPPARHRNGRPLKTLAQRLKGKEGRFRYNLSGKRVNFSSRTVISPDPLLSINEVGVPMDVANKLTLPEHVTSWNIDELKKYVEAKVYPKAEYVIKEDGRRKKITDMNREDILKELAPGYVVERNIKNGDLVLFNRQPSLHRMSIMAHRVKVLPGRTFRLHPCVCPPYNADFDGDEMNLHVPQTPEAIAEAKALMYVQNQIISPRFGGPIIHGSQDYVSGGYIMTRMSQKFTKEEAYGIAAKGGYTELPEPDLPDGYYSGKLLFSLTLPKKLDIEYKSKLAKRGDESDEDATVKIEGGMLKSGVVDKTAYQGILLDTIAREYGTDAAREFLDNSTKMVIETLMKRGFTTSVSDSELPKPALDEIDAIIKKAKEEVGALIDQYHNGLLERIPGKTIEETREDRIMDILGRARQDCGRIAEKYLSKDNSAMIMAGIGARGSILNVTQMAACVGQQAIRGGRVLRGYRHKSLPHFKEGDLSAEARGFVTNSFKKGLTPLEYFFHAMGGREGLVDKGIRTAKSGYMQRRLINALQDISMHGDGTVRNAAGTIIQFRYGDDGANPMKCKGSKLVLEEVG